MYVPIGHDSSDGVPGRCSIGTRTTAVPYQIDEEAAPLPQQPRGRQALPAARSTNGVVAGLSTPAWLPPCCSPLFDFSPARDHLNDRSTVGGLSAGGCGRSRSFRARNRQRSGRDIQGHSRSHAVVFFTKNRATVWRCFLWRADWRGDT